MLNPSIEYRSIIMRCDHINHHAFRNLPESVSIEYYQNGMEETWKEIQKSAGEFSTKSDAEILSYFHDQFGHQKSLLGKRCLFLKDRHTGCYIGTCMAWNAVKAGHSIPILHWLAISDSYAGQGLARVLISQVLHIFEQECPSEPVYLHTQPCSYPAIKLYHDFGFNICRTDTYGTAINEYEQAIAVLKQYMTEESYLELYADSVE